MIRQCKHLDAVLLKYWRELIHGTTWIDAYNCAVNNIATTLTTRCDQSNMYFLNDTRRNKANSN